MNLALRGKSYVFRRGKGREEVRSISFRVGSLIPRQGEVGIALLGKSYAPKQEGSGIELASCGQSYVSI